jgi:hypothetical protein
VNDPRDRFVIANDREEYLRDFRFYRNVTQKFWSSSPCDAILFSLVRARRIVRLLKSPPLYILETRDVGSRIAVFGCEGEVPDWLKNDSM